MLLSPAVSNESLSIEQTFESAVSEKPQTPEQILPLLYGELRRLARSQMAKLPPGQTLEPTGLVHEAYLRLSRLNSTFEGRRHFFFAASRAMRDILVERARWKGSLKRGGDCQRVELGDWMVSPLCPEGGLADLGRAMEAFESRHPDHARIVDLRYFCGLSLSEVASITGWSLATVKRRWSYARVWLKRELGAPSDSSK